jgi:hypothetical protein
MQALNISSQSEADRLAAVFLYDSLLLRAQERKELQARESRKRRLKKKSKPSARIFSFVIVESKSVSYFTKLNIS